MKQLKVNLGTIAANADQIFHRLRWANGVACPSVVQSTSIILRQANFITVQTTVAVSQTLPIPSFIKMTSHLLKRL